MSEETTLYEAGEIKVTNLRAVFGQKTYSISNVSAVEARQVPVSGCVPGFFFGIGGLATLYSLSNVRELVPTLLLGVVLLVVGFAIMSGKPQYAVQITTSSGEVKAYTSSDQGEIKNIVAALNDAIIKKG